MKTLWVGAIGGLLLAASSARAATCDWPAWSQFKKDYLGEQGRVIDPSDERKITTSEGQSYGLFFALVANDKIAFDTILTWTQNNLAEGALSKQLPAWLWGKTADNQWKVLDTNSASDADMWIAWSLVEAGRLWDRKDYAELGQSLLNRIAKEEVVNVPGLGWSLMPGKSGFAKDGVWKMNPSYLPPQVLARMVRYGTPWSKMRGPNTKLLMDTSPKGFAPDWVSWQKGKGWQMNAKPALAGSYDAIRVYLWAGMLSDKDPDKAKLLNHFQPMIAATAQRGAPPEKIAITSGKLQNDGNVAFTASLLPALDDSPALYVQRQRLQAQFPTADAYYSYVLILFGQGWDQHRFRFNLQGELVPNWDTQCASSQ